LGNLRASFTTCAAVLALAIHGNALASEASRPAVTTSTWDALAYPMPGQGAAATNLADSPFLIEPPFPQADSPMAEDASARTNLAVAGFMAEAPLSRASVAARIAALGPSTAEVEEELNCLALNIYHEARNEPDEGQFAVAHVVLNRISDPRFPETVCKVIRQGGERVRHRCQFSWWCDGRSDRPRNQRKWQTIKAMAEAVYWGRSEDPTGGALWYHADYVSPYWGRVFKRSRQIGRHIFYLDRDKPTRVASRATQTASAP
jgi:spore germination cell wall hydrolase CwlJ-like protein